MANPFLDTERLDDVLVVRVRGPWLFENVSELERASQEVREAADQRHSTSRLTTTNWLESSCVFRCRCTRENMRCEVELPMSMPTVVSSTFSAFQIVSASAARPSSEISWKCGVSSSCARHGVPESGTCTRGQTAHGP